MNTQRRTDPLLRTLRPESTVRADRLHYATGELLGADDFSAEQTYHRRQLARALLLLQGSGTIAGLRVETKIQTKELAGGALQLDEVELIVQPGLAIDRAGRLIEVPRPHCLRLLRWFQHLAAAEPDHTPQDEDDRDDLRQAFRPADNHVVADVFLRFHECDRSPTPAFANGPFDALDASQPSRTRDAHELRLVLRKELDADLNDNAKAGRAYDPWQIALAQAQAGPANDTPIKVLREANLGGWDPHQFSDLPATAAFREYPENFDRTAVLLARLRIPAVLDSGGFTLSPNPAIASWQAASARPNNAVRNFILAPALALRVGITVNP